MMKIHRRIGIIIISLLAMLAISIPVMGKELTEDDFRVESEAFVDMDTDAGEISGVVNFTVNQDDVNVVEEYVLGFNLFGIQGGDTIIIDSIIPENQEEYTFTIPEDTMIPEGFGQIELMEKYKGKNSTVGFIRILDYSPTVLSSINKELDAYEDFLISYGQYLSRGPGAIITLKPVENSPASWIALYYLNEKNEKIKRIGEMYIDGINAYIFSFDNYPKTTDAKAIGVFSKNSDGESENFIAIPLLFLKENSLVDKSTFIDSDLDEDEIGGTLTWQKLNDENRFDKYSVYIIPDGYSPYKHMGKIGEVPASGQDQYSIEIPMNTHFDENQHVMILPEIKGYYTPNNSYWWTADVTDRTTQNIQSGWSKVSGEWYYFDKAGEKVKGWVLDNGEWYYLDDRGAMKTGWITSNGKWYFLTDGGSMKTGWLNDGGKWFYLSSEGEMKTGWLKDDGKWYHFASSGEIETGWVKSAGQWYYMNSTGSMKTGWLKDSGYWYYLSADGSMESGWKTIDSKWYYFYSGGSMASNTTIDGYQLDRSGAWLQ
ncbi:hypothetical protein A6P54_13005 [Bacillus sp. MKU004]|nr:hypothetical protein A6P54_13005 [Bacillus sp. MKU004]